MFVDLGWSFQAANRCHLGGLMDGFPVCPGSRGTGMVPSLLPALVSQYWTGRIVVAPEGSRQDPSTRGLTQLSPEVGARFIRTVGPHSELTFVHRPRTYTGQKRPSIHLKEQRFNAEFRIALR